MNQEKNYLTTAKEQGFTLVEVIVAVAILSFVIFATLRVITASLNSITRQGQRVKALHLAQAHLAKLEAESFSRVVPEIWRIGVGGADWYQLTIYDPIYLGLSTLLCGFAAPLIGYPCLVSNTRLR
ncbi:unnamed protein product [marine sediment metagenome]|uniref:Uncharacterized protein n=1 Tax=marine sediment metagenome TaxID=412755 RepID=X1CQW5_9ZZZZ